MLEDLGATVRLLRGNFNLPRPERVVVGTLINYLDNFAFIVLKTNIIYLFACYLLLDKGIERLAVIVICDISTLTWQRLDAGRWLDTMRCFLGQ